MIYDDPNTRHGGYTHRPCQLRVHLAESGHGVQDKLVKVGKKLKKNNVAVDIVSFGSEESNADKLEAFVQAVNSGENSHLVTVPAGTILADILFGSPIFQTEGGQTDCMSSVSES